MFRYLVVGLLDENVRVVQVVPQRLPEAEASTFGAKLTWRDTRWGFLRTHRLARLAGKLHEQKVDLVHALDGRLWPAAIKLSQKLGCPCVLTASSREDVVLGQKLFPQHGELRIGVAATTQPLVDGLAGSMGASHVLSLVRPGVHVPREFAGQSSHGNALCAVISGGNVFDAEYESLFIGLAPIVTSNVQMQFFIDSHQEDDQHLIWQAAQKLGLLANVSLVPRRLGHREILLGADMLIHPQPLGCSRGLTLQAMAAGIPVIAHADPWLDYLLHGRTAWIVDRPHPALWTGAIERLIQEPAHRVELGRGARQWVSDHHLAAWHVNDTIALYRQVLDEPLRFPGSNESAERPAEG